MINLVLNLNLRSQHMSFPNCLCNSISAVLLKILQLSHNLIVLFETATIQAMQDNALTQD